jgi:hypothetical protein
MATGKELMQLGGKLVEMCNQGRDSECLDQLYAQDAVSAEAVAMPGAESAEAVGLDAIRGKHEWWYNAHEVHSSQAEGPFVHGDNQFSVIFDMDVTQKDTGDRMQMREVATYFVNEQGQINREEFSYALDE